MVGNLIEKLMSAPIGDVRDLLIQEILKITGSAPFDPQPIPGVKVVGLGHKARHGKDTVAGHILQLVPGARRYSFADDLYALCRVLYGMGEKDAPLLQRVGTEVGRSVDENIWVRAVYHKLLQDRPPLAVFPDTRFPNEVNLVKAMGGTTVKVTRLNPDDTPFVDPSRPSDHPSEASLNSYDDWDWHITARFGELDVLKEGARLLVKELGF